MRRLTALALGLALLGACGDRSAGNGQAAPAPAPAENVAAPPVSQSGNASAAADGVTAQWLTGSWQADNPDCTGDGFFTLEAGGAYGFMEEEGRWTLAGNALTIEIVSGGEDGGSRPGDRHTVTVRMIGPDEAEFAPAQGPAAHVYRCREAGR